MKKLSMAIRTKIDANRKKLIKAGVDLDDENLQYLMYEIGQKQYLRFKTGNLLIGFKSEL